LLNNLIAQHISAFIGHLQKPRIPKETLHNSHKILLNSLSNLNEVRLYIFETLKVDNALIQCRRYIFLCYLVNIMPKVMLCMIGCNILKVNLSPLQALKAHRIVRSRLPHFPNNQLTDGGDAVISTRRLPFTPRKILGTHFS
jgi:hypothetical protein